MATLIKPPIPVGYIDGSLDPDGLAEDGLTEYLEHVQKARTGSELRKQGHRKKKGKRDTKSNSASKDNAKEQGADECEAIACAKSGNSARLKELLDEGWDHNTTDKHGSNGLHWAAGAGHVDVLEILVNHGLSINSCNRFALRFDRFELIRPREPTQ
jgi:ankyrin repeat protein